MTESPKNNIRCFLKTVLAQLPLHRRKEGQAKFLSVIAHLHAANALILSFASFGDEIETSLINQFLAINGCLLLPKIEGIQLIIYHVNNPTTDLLTNQFGIKEPNPKLCQKVFPSQIRKVLVPALGFDRQKNRIGYGKGFYDRFLCLNPKIKTYGVGFREQMIEKLPTAAHDIPLDSLLLF
ncbi:MAG: 5-formyltetrahydrofolate cyclo-ligase [Chlamydiia bacterium]|nr:5-formyltetrahydrofolate cyclo-ligase [Chlamydiia bacterium]